LFVGADRDLATAVLRVYGEGVVTRIHHEKEEVRDD
jgi:hypothetical protein